MNSSSTGGHGFGLGLRTAHYQDFLSRPQCVDWLEIIIDNFLVEGGKPLVILERIRRDYPVAMHGVAMSIGATSGLDLAYLSRVKQLARRLEPMWVSDHLCWTGVAPNVLHDLYPMPYTEESARLLIAQIRQAQDVLERRLVIENVSSYVRFPASTETEWTFLAHVIEEADCDLLLDVNNVYVSSINHGFSALAYLEGLPAERVRQIHLAGHSRVDKHIIDTHDHPVAPEVWELYWQACRRFPHVATMIERDDNIPPLEILIAELDHARAIAARVVAEPRVAVQPAQSPAANWQCSEGALQAMQYQMAAHILQESAPALPDGIDPRGVLPGDQGMQIYHRAYRERLIEVLADSFTKCELYLGSDLFRDLASRYIETHPPRERNLGRYGAAFPTLLAKSYPDNVELRDLAQLEWSLREVFDGIDMPAWTVIRIEEEGVEACLAQSPALHTSLRLQWLRSNAVAIWHAINGDAEVPEAVRFDSSQALAVWRKGLQPHFKTIDTLEAGFLTELAVAGASIASVAQSWSGSGKLQDPAMLGGWMASWWEDELLRRDTSALQHCNR